MKSKYSITTAVILCFILGLVAGRLSYDQDGRMDGQLGSGINGGQKSLSTAPAGPRSNSKIGSGKANWSLASASYPEDPLERMEMVMKQSADMRAREWELFVDSLDVSQFEEMTEEFRRRRYSAENYELFSKLWSSWAKRDPLVFLRKSLSMKTYSEDEQYPDDYLYEMDPMCLSEFQRDALSALAVTNPQKALNWALENKLKNDEEDDVNRGLSSVIGQIAKTDLQQAFEIICSLPESVDRAAMLDPVSSIYLSRGIDEACSWAFGVEDDKLRAQAISNLSEKFLINDSVGFAEWLLANPSESAIDAMGDVMKHMTVQDVGAAIDSYRGIENRDMRSSALEGLVNQEAVAENPHAIIALMDEDASVVTDDVALEFVRCVYAKDASLAISNIHRIQKAELRKEAYRTYMLSWLRDDHQKATEWLNTHGIPEDMR